MKAANAYTIYQKNRLEPLWKLLAADNAPAILAVLTDVFADSPQDIPAAEFFQRMRHALEAVRETETDMPLSERDYAAAWCREQILERRLPEGSEEDVYSLSAASAEALRIVGTIHSPKSRATESHFLSLLQSIYRLAEESDPNIERRKERLYRQRDKINAEIAALERGDIQTLTDARVLMERLDEVLMQSNEIISAFYRVRNEFEEVNRGLARVLLGDAPSKGEVLERVFKGIDVIGASPAGRTFSAFWNLLNDQTESALFEDALDSILERDFARDLPAAKRKELRFMRRTLLAKAGEIHRITTRLACGLRHFVQGEGYREEKKFHRLLGETMQLGLDRAEKFSLTTPTGLKAARPALRPVAALRLVPLNPEKHAPVPKAEKALRPTGEMVRAAQRLVEASDIDFRSLIEDILAVLALKNPCTIGDVMRIRPSDQGLAGLVGLLQLSAECGTPGSGEEHVEWTGRDGAHRAAFIPQRFFQKETFQYG